MALLTARVFDGAIAHLCTTGTTWVDGTIKAKFINDQAFSRSAAVSDYTTVMDSDLALGGKAINLDATNSFVGLDCNDILSDITTAGTDTDACVIYRDAATDVPLFYVPFTNVAIGAGNTATIVCPTTGLFQFHGSVPALINSWLTGAIDVEALPTSLQAFTVATLPAVATINGLTATSNKLTIGFELSDENLTWAGGTFQRRIRTYANFDLNVEAGLMHGLVIGDPDADLMYAYVPLIRNVPTAQTITFNTPSEGFLAIGGV